MRGMGDAGAVSTQDLLGGLPVPVVLTRPAETIPAPGALPGGASYEPKWDGFRALLSHAMDGRVRVWSRHGTDMTNRFPDVVAAATVQTPPGTVVDAELVVWSEDRLDFTALARRMATGPRTINALVRRSPVSVAAFDLLAHAGTDLRDQPWSVRRARLEDLAAGWVPPMNLTPVTADRAVALAWFAELVTAGVEGVVVKGAGQRYRGGQRDWVKVKHRATLEVVAAAVLGTRARPTVVVAGLPVGGRLRIVGRTTQLSGVASRTLARVLVDPVGAHPWPPVVPASGAFGFGADRAPVALVRVAPVVVEVAADVAWTGRGFRHPLRFQRVRPDVDPGQVTPPDTH